jgi:ankyrin repeat protein
MSFIIACENGNRKIAELLLQNKEVDVKYTDEKGRTALHYAAHRGYLDIVKILTEDGADINYEDHQGETPLYFACLQKQKQTALYLLENGAEITKNDKDGSS